MSELSEIDKGLLEKVRRNIEVRAGLSGGELLSQKDFEFLQYFIKENAGETLSLTTIKRIWKNDFQRLPHLTTLDILCKLAFERDWHTLKKEYVESNSAQKPEEISGTRSNIQPSRVAKSGQRLRAKLLAALVLFVVAAAGLYYLSSLAPIDTSGIEFSALPTVDERIPNSVVFSYDVNGYRANHFYIQQSWDPARKVEVSAVNTKQTDIYYEPGYHYAKLMGDDQVLKEIPVHIRYNDWYVRVRYPDSRLVKVNEDDLLNRGYLGVSDAYAKELVKEDFYQLGYMLSKDFDLSADDLQLRASVRFDSINVEPCPTLNVLIKGSGGYSWLTLGTKGCESNFGLIFGDEQVNGKTNDLTAMALDSHSWQQIAITAKDGKFKLVVNDRLGYEGDYSRNLGDLKEVDFFFLGIGSLDNINVSDSQNKSLVSQQFNEE